MEKIINATIHFRASCHLHVADGVCEDIQILVEQSEKSSELLEEVKPSSATANRDRKGLRVEVSSYRHSIKCETLDFVKL